MEPEHGPTDGSTDAVDSTAVGAMPVKPKRGYLLPGTIALTFLAVVAGVAGVTVLESHNPSALNGHDVATELSQAIQAQHRQRTPPQLRCPPSEPDRAGLVFDCTLTRAVGSTVTVKVTETSSSGTFSYRVLGPLSS